MLLDISGCLSGSIERSSINPSVAVIKASPNPKRKPGVASRKLTLSIAGADRNKPSADKACTNIVIKLPAMTAHASKFSCDACIR